MDFSVPVTDRKASSRVAGCRAPGSRAARSASQTEAAPVQPLSQSLFPTNGHCGGSIGGPWEILKRETMASY